MNAPNGYDVTETSSPSPLEFLRKICHKSGLRVTPQRIAIYQELCTSRKHPTAEQLHTTMKRRFPGISLNTVNLTLLKFAEIGLIDIVEGYGSPRRYDPRTEAHHHVHCIKCGCILDFESPDFDRLDIPQEVRREYQIVGMKVVLVGICTHCRLT
jgi:Fur family peroxide stress response transcriptional regulator